MNSENEQLINQTYSYENMEEIDRNFYLNLILQSKDVSDSDINTNDYCNKYDILWIKMCRDKSTVRFDGVIFNKSERKMINGTINNRGNTYYLVTNVYRCSDYVFGEDKEYVTYDNFRFEDDRVVRMSRYENTLFTEKEIEYNDPVEIDNYLENMVMSLKK